MNRRRLSPEPALRFLVLSTALLSLTLAACSGDTADDQGGRRAGRGQSGGPPGRGGMSRGGEGTSAAVPVEVARVERRKIASYIETNGTLEAENEVDIVARTAAPIVELLTEEGRQVTRGQLLARLDDAELRAQLEIHRVTLDETQLAYERAKTLQADELISTEEYEQAAASYEFATAQVQATEIQLSYTEVRAPFDGWIVTRYVQFAEQVNNNTPMFRVSDFDPLLCTIRVPERELPRLRDGQPAHLTVEPWPDERFDARVLRISPVIDQASGTIRVTLEVRSRNRLRPGMFARVFVEAETRDDALVVPKTALSLESIGDTVFVAADGVAARRDVELGFSEGDHVEIVSGVQESDAVIVVGQDGLSDGTPVQVLQAGTSLAAGGPQPQDRADGHPPPMRGEGGPAGPGGPPPGARGRGERGGRGGPPPGGGGRERPDFASMTPEQLERIKERMRQRGMTEEQIDERIERMKQRTQQEDR
ncbi:MAG: efflux RND transporter periplasmic adaptor subunit [bacterium]|nr:efflux RND transporter periplasmic adaptor subunit [bacterium]